jgi:hypothetical protein
MDINTTIVEPLKEPTVELENMEPGAKLERDSPLGVRASETFAITILSVDPLLAQRKVRMGSKQKASAHPLQTEFIPMTRDALQNLNVVPNSIAPRLRLKPGYMARAEGTSQSGADKLWSSSDFHRHLKFLANIDRTVSATLKSRRV